MQILLNEAEKGETRVSSNINLISFYCALIFEQAAIFIFRLTRKAEIS